jgi:hypothetical protein
MVDETKQDIPGWVVQKASETIRRWQEQNKPLIDKMNEKFKGYKITSGSDENGKPKGQDRGRRGTEYLFDTKSAGRWQILIGRKPNWSPPPNLEDWQRAEIQKNLTINQRLEEQIASPQEANHQQAMRFLVANWSILREIFYPLEIQNVQAAPAVFFEVEFSNNDRADIIGVGPDGRYIILEIGKGGKSSQIERYKTDLLEMGIPEEMLIGYVVTYSFFKRQNTLVILPIF